MNISRTLFCLISLAAIALALSAVAATAAEKVPYEFYIVRADGNIITVANSKVDHVAIVRADDGKTYTQEFHFADGRRVARKTVM